MLNDFSVAQRLRSTKGIIICVSNESENYTLAVGMQQYLNPQNYLWGDFAAAAVLSAIPITAVFLFAQKWLVGGLTAGGNKG